MILRSILTCFAVMMMVSGAAAYEPTDSYESRTMEGWSVRTSARLLAEGELAQRTLELLRVKLSDANRAIPQGAVDALRQETVIWVERDGERFPGMCYHPSRQWLRENGFNPDKAGGIEIGNARNFLSWSREQPSMVIHELAHAWFDRLADAQQGAVRDAFERARDTGLYERVLRASGNTERAYAMNNVQEYFAELSEALLGTNDFFPFVRAELRRHDPRGYDAIAAAWEAEPSNRPAAPTTHSVGAGDPMALKSVQVAEQTPLKVVRLGEGHYFADFGRAAFGYLVLEIESLDAREIEIHLGEKASGESVERKPGGTIRHVATRLKLEPGKRRYRVETQPDKRNTTGDAVPVPAEIGGVILPFRYVEVSNCPVELDPSMIRRAMVLYPFDDDASAFRSSDERLNQIWDLCKYSIKATTAFGIYVDGDRERIPYEADAYINQLSHYCVDREYALARHTHEYLLKKPTWPTEWKQHSVLMAHADWMWTADVESIRRNFDVLKSEKTLSKHARADGLLDTRALRDIVDWPAGERDGFRMSPVNTVVNAFHYRTLVLMAEMAQAIGRADDAEAMKREAKRVQAAFNQKLFDAVRGVYVDGEGIDHASLHANLFPLAFGLVPNERRSTVVAFIRSRGMACSVYPAQFLLEALFENGEADHALSLMTAEHDRGWLNMMRAGSTITLEAWDLKYKPNLDWNHAWGAAPANILPRYVLGVRPLQAGFRRILIAPQPGDLKFIEGVVPTIRGPIEVKLDVAAKRLEVEIPPEVKARIVPPWKPEAPQEVGTGRHVFHAGD